MSFGDVRSIDELHDILLWESPSVIQVPYAGLFTSLAAADEALLSVYIDKAVGNKSTTDSSSLPDLPGELIKFGSWGSVGGTLFNHMYKLTGFQPTDDKLDPKVFAAFKDKFWCCPYFLNRTSDYRDVHLRITNYMKAVDAVIDLIDRIVDSKSKESIIDSIKKIAQLAAENVRKTQKNSLFHQGGISVIDGKMNLFYLSNYVEMRATGGKHSVIEQDTQITRVFGELDVEYCKRHADALLRYDEKSLDDWEKSGQAYTRKENTSPGWGQ